MRFGSHVSCAGGLLKGIERAVALGCDCIQVFVSSPRQWPKEALLIPFTAAPAGKDKQPAASVTPEEESKLFAHALRESSLSAPIAHASYLINLASCDEELWQKSIAALCVEWKRADQLQLEGLVLHPGSRLKHSIDDGVNRVVAGVRMAIEQVQPNYCRLLLENTAGQGSCLGHEISQLGWMLKNIDRKPHMGICWDTCHAFAAGYDFRTARGMKSLVTELEEHIGIGNLNAVHINDSKKECGSRVDRHEHIGRGEIGEAGFKRFLHCSAFNSLPMYLETEKEVDSESGEEWDAINLKVLRRLSSFKAD
jgi:deoxyribonuclease IV